ncbi:MAG: S8 family peptidase [bacterium]
MRFFSLSFLISVIFLLPSRPICASYKPLENVQSRRSPYWVLFKDRGPDTLNQYVKALDLERQKYDSRALLRREKVKGTGMLELDDLPPYEKYVEKVQRLTGRKIRVASRWLNGITLDLSEEEVNIVRQLSFVDKVHPVARWWRKPEEEKVEEIDPEFLKERELKGDILPLREAAPPNRDDYYHYGSAYTQNAMLNIPALHNRGLRGDGVRIGLLDAGFNNLEHICFQYMRLVATYDFVNDDENVDDEEDMGEGSHGTRTLSIIAGLDPGRFVGVAPEAQFILAKTENTDWERPVEEDYWVAGLEWMDRLGVDVVSSSLSYTDWYDYENMDGETAITTRAAQRAAQVGIIVVNSMGNTGQAQYPRNKMGAPADGEFVISVGGVNRDSSYARFPSQGPTYDRRIKPDVEALANGVVFASVRDRVNYGSGLGTSFSTPAIAGLCALLIQANPHLTPREVRDLLREAGHRHQNPDTLRGWGIPDGFRALQASALPPREVVIPLRQGWNLISFNVYTDPTQPFTFYFTELVERGRLEIVKDDQGRFYNPRWEFNNIPYWDYLKGYYIKVNEPDTLTYRNEPVSFIVSIPIRRGWQIVAYLPDFSLSAEVAFRSLTELGALTLVKDDRGNFFLPDFGFNNMGALHPGKGYYLKSRANSYLRYPRRVDRGDEIQANDDQLYPAPHFFPRVPIGEWNMSLLLLASEGIRDGDEVAWVTPSGEIAGSGVFRDGKCGLAVSEIGVSGLEKLLWWDSQNNRELILNREVVWGDEEWKPNGIGVWRVEPQLYELGYKAMTKTSSQESLNITIFPNPFNASAEVKLTRFLPQTPLAASLINLEGRTLLEWKMIPDRTREVSFIVKGDRLPSGTYFLSVRQQKEMRILKLILMR